MNYHQFYENKKNRQQFLKKKTIKTSLLLKIDKNIVKKVHVNVQSSILYKASALNDFVPVL